MAVLDIGVRSRQPDDRTKDRTMAKIQVDNYTSSGVKVSIDQWGRGGNTSHWTVAAADGNVPGSEKWDREDGRGFIMTLARHGAGDVPYYVRTNAVISVRDDVVEENGRSIAPVGKIPSDDKSTGYTLTVRNNTNADIHASINQWGKRGNTSAFKIKPLDTEGWEREDVRGFVLALKTGSSTAHYYVQRTSVIVVNAGEVTDRGEAISPVA